MSNFEISEALIIEKFGQDTKQFATLIRNLFAMHCQLVANAKNEPSKPNLQLQVANDNSDYIVVTIANHAFMSYDQIMHCKSEFDTFDDVCFNVEVCFNTLTTSYYLSKKYPTNLPHFFYSCKPLKKSKQSLSEINKILQDTYETNASIHEQSKCVVQQYVQHCDLIPRFSIFEDCDRDDCFEVVISGIEKCDAHFLFHLYYTLKPQKITVSFPKCKGELACEFTSPSSGVNSLEYGKSRKRKRNLLGAIKSYVTDS